MQISEYNQFRSDIHSEDVLDIIEKTAIASPHDIRFNRDYWRAWLHEIIKQPDLYTVILGVEEGKIVGIIVGQLYSVIHWFSFPRSPLNSSGMLNLIIEGRIPSDLWTSTRNGLGRLVLLISQCPF